jgi:hypothetical protein
MFSIGGQFAGSMADAWSLTGVLVLGGAICVALAVLLFAAPGMTLAAESALGVEPAPARS